MNAYGVSNTRHEREGGVGQRWHSGGVRHGWLGQQHTVKGKERESVIERDREREREWGKGFRVFRFKGRRGDMRDGKRGRKRVWVKTSRV